MCACDVTPVDFSHLSRGHRLPSCPVSPRAPSSSRPVTHSMYTSCCARMRLNALTQVLLQLLLLLRSGSWQPSPAEPQHLAAGCRTRSVRVQTFCCSFLQLINFLPAVAASLQPLPGAKSQEPGTRSQGAGIQGPSLGLSGCTRRQVHVKLTHPLECPDQAETSCFCSRQRLSPVIWNQFNTRRFKKPGSAAASENRSGPSWRSNHLENIHRLRRVVRRLHIWSSNHQHSW